MKTFKLCVAVALVAIAVIWVFRIPFGTVGFALALLACPLLHVFMMKDHKH